LKRSSLEEMFQPQLPAATDANGNAGFTTDIGLTFFIDTRGGGKLIGHGGDQNGFISYIDVNVEKRTAAILVFNTNVSKSGVYDTLRREARKLL
jgi:hypothetical protein